MGLKINLDNRTEFVPNLIATSKVQPDCQDPVADSDRLQPAIRKPFNARSRVSREFGSAGRRIRNRER